MMPDTRKPSFQVDAVRSPNAVPSAKGEEYRNPVERLSAPRVDTVNGESLLAQVPTVKFAASAHA